MSELGFPEWVNSGQPPESLRERNPAVEFVDYTIDDDNDGIVEGSLIDDRGTEYSFGMKSGRLLWLDTDHHQFASDNPTWHQAHRFAGEKVSAYKSIDQLRELIRSNKKESLKLSFSDEEIISILRRNATVEKEIGVANSSGITAYFSSNPNRTFGFYVLEGASQAPSPDEINQKVLQYKSMGNNKKFLAVVDGSDLAFLQKYHQALTEPDFIVYCSSDSNLKSLGVPIVDEGWNSDEPQAGSIDDYLFDSPQSEPPPTETKQQWGPSSANTGKMVRPSSANRPTQTAPDISTAGTGPRTVRRAADIASEMGADPGMGQPPVGRPSQAIDTDDFSQVAQQYLNSDEPELDDLDAGVHQNGNAISTGSTVREAGTGTMGTVRSVEGDMALVDFQDSEDTAKIPIQELEQV